MTPDPPRLDQPRFVSTGRLPDMDRVRALLETAHERFSSVDQGQLSTVYPALERADPASFGLCVVRVGGDVLAIGDSDVDFPVMSVIKPFVFALVCEAIGAEGARQRLGVGATGLPFDSLEAADRGHGRTNPMVNPGAIAAVGLVPGEGTGQRWDRLQTGLSAFAGRALVVHDETYRSASASNLRNRAIVQLLASFDAITGDPADVLDLYTRACSLSVTARDLALMGATLANGGVHPLTRRTVVSAGTCRHVLAVMTTAGMYEASGDWLYDVGLPGKSGIGGGIVTVAPGKGGLGTFSPLLDETGNSVRGQLAAAWLSRALGLDLFASESAARGDGAWP